MLGVLFRPPGTLYGLNVGLCLAGLSPRSLARLRPVPTLVALCALPIPFLLFCVSHGLWLETGSGEANFLYFQCLGYTVFVVQLTLEFTGASLRRDKALRVTEKILLREKTDTKEQGDAVVVDDDDGRIKTDAVAAETGG